MRKDVDPGPSAGTSHVMCCFCLSADGSWRVFRSTTFVSQGHLPTKCVTPGGCQTPGATPPSKGSGACEGRALTAGAGLARALKVGRQNGEPESIL